MEIETRNGMPVVTMTEAKALAWAMAKSRATGTTNKLALAIVAAPGVGKGALAAWLAHALKRPLIIGMTGSSTREDQFVLLPLGDGTVSRVPIAPWERACSEACVVLVDEVTRIGPTDQGGLLTAMQDGWVGDKALHPDTFLLCCWNDEGSTGAGQIIGALRNRVTAVYLKPSAAEVGAHFMRQAESVPMHPRSKSMLRALGVALQFKPDLLDLDPDKVCAAEQAGLTWASPRAWFKGVIAAGELKDDRMQDIVLAGAVTLEKALALRAIARLQGELPTVADVTRDPGGCIAPKRVEACVAAIGTVYAVLEAGAHDAALLYACRLPAEIRGALGVLARKAKPETEAGKKAQRILAGEATAD